ncbi:MAG: hypothetical protein SNG35_03615 [Rikenellaceae bacterium]
MENRLQELTQRLYDEGLERGKSEGETILAEAKTEAKKIVDKANEEAKGIVAAAEAKAADVEKNSMTEIALAGKQAMGKIKSEISSMIVSKSIEKGVKAAAIDGKFIAQMMVAVAQNWSGSQGGEVSLVALLPEANKASLDKAIKSSAAELLKAGVEVGYSEEVRSGFKVGEKGGGYYISFTDSDFDALMRTYLRERVAELLFKA